MATRTSHLAVMWRPGCSHFARTKTPVASVVVISMYCSSRFAQRSYVRQSKTRIYAEPSVHHQGLGGRTEQTRWHEFTKLPVSLADSASFLLQGHP